MATKDKEVIDFLKYLTKLGASKVITDLYKRYSIISCSSINNEEGYPEPHEFTAQEGIPWSWVKKVLDTERFNNLTVYHILTGNDNNLGPKLTCLYYSNNNVNSHYDLLKGGRVNYFNYYPDIDMVLWFNNEYKIECGKIKISEPKTCLIKKEGGINNEFVSKGN